MPLNTASPTCPYCCGSLAPAPRLDPRRVLVQVTPEFRDRWYAEEIAGRLERRPHPEIDPLGQSAARRADRVFGEPERRLHVRQRDEVRPRERRVQPILIQPGRERRTRAAQGRGVELPVATCFSTVSRFRLMTSIGSPVLRRRFRILAALSGGVVAASPAAWSSDPGPAGKRSRRRRRRGAGAAGKNVEGALGGSALNVSSSGSSGTLLPPLECPDHFFSARAEQAQGVRPLQAVPCTAASILRRSCVPRPGTSARHRAPPSAPSAGSSRRARRRARDPRATSPSRERARGLSPFAQQHALIDHAVHQRLFLVAREVPLAGELLVDDPLFDRVL